LVGFLFKKQKSMATSISSVIKLERGVSRAISSFMKEKNINRPLRISLNFSGCCDASLCLRVDDARKSDMVFDIEGLTLVISPETYELKGKITVSYVNESGREGFMIRSSKPVSEWEGFGASDIKF
jgi:Fe-S cluster assembly iron-binding protein IscA